MTRRSVIKRQAAELRTAQELTGVKHEFTPAAASAIVRAGQVPTVDRELIRRVGRGVAARAVGRDTGSEPTFVDLIRATNEAQQANGGRSKESR